MAVNCFTCLLVSSTCKIHPFTSFWRSFPRISQPNIDFFKIKLQIKYFLELVLKQQSSWFEWNSCYLLNRKKERKARRKQKNKGFELWPGNVLTIVIQSSKSVVEINTGEKYVSIFCHFRLLRIQKKFCWSEQACS